MDWEKSKSILIWIFLFLNIFLAVNLVINAAGNEAGVSSDDAMQILEARGLRFEAGSVIPPDKGMRHALVFENSDFDRERLIRALVDPDHKADDGGIPADGPASAEKDSRKISFSSLGTFVFKDDGPSQQSQHFETGNQGNGIAGLEDQCRKYLEDLGFKLKTFVLDRYDDEEGVLVFIEKYHDMMVYDNHFRIYCKNGSLSRIECGYRNIIGYSKLSSDIIPIFQVLLLWDYGAQEAAAADAGGNEGAAVIAPVIAHMDLGFKRYGTELPSDDMTEFTQSPAWRVVLDDGRELFFKAYDAGILK